MRRGLRSRELQGVVAGGVQGAQVAAEEEGVASREVDSSVAVVSAVAAVASWVVLVAGMGVASEESP